MPLMPTMPRIPGAGAFGRIPGVRTYVTPSMFFDRAAVIGAMERGKHRALMKIGGKIRDYAVKSIKKRGKARPPLKLQRDLAELSIYENADPNNYLSVLHRHRDTLTRSQARAVTKRMLEIALKRQDGSPPGTPPYTHVDPGHMLGFRRNIYFAYDVGRRSVVIGPQAKGNQPLLPALHEWGGAQTLLGYERLGRKAQPLPPQLKVVVWFSSWARPNKRRWLATGDRRRVHYPARPFMRPALRKAIATGDIGRAFERCAVPLGTSAAVLRRV